MKVNKILHHTSNLKKTSGVVKKVNIKDKMVHICTSRS